MPLEEEKLLRLKQQRSERAIALAMQGQWREAVAVNKNIVESFPGDVEAYNRLGRAHLELGEYSQAKEAYNRTVERDPYNIIAKKNLQRLSYLKETMVSSGTDHHKVEPHHFIEEIGKAGVVNLHALAPKEVLAMAVAGDRVNLKISGPSLIMENSRGEYLGEVTPRHAQRLIKLMKGGNKYSAAVVSSTESTMTVIIREEYQHPSQAERLSFPSRGLGEVRPYVSDRIVKAEYEEEAAEESGYTVIGGEEIEVLPEEAGDVDDEISDED